MVRRRLNNGDHLFDGNGRRIFPIHFPIFLRVRATTPQVFLLVVNSFRFNSNTKRVSTQFYANSFDHNSMSSSSSPQCFSTIKRTCWVRCTFRRYIKCKKNEGIKKNFSFVCSPVCVYVCVCAVCSNETATRTNGSGKWMKNPIRYYCHSFFLSHFFDRSLKRCNVQIKPVFRRFTKYHLMLCFGFSVQIEFFDSVATLFWCVCVVIKLQLIQWTAHEPT